MPRRRFRWTRENYRKAASLVRFLARHPQQEDPLLRPHWQRFGTDSIPF